MYICTYVYYMILLYLEGSGSKFHSVNTKTSQFSSFFGFQELRKNMCIYNMYICTYVYYMILLYLEGSGSKFHSVNTKTGQFSSFFGFQKFEKKHVNTKTSQFPPFFGFQELRKNMSTPKLVNFPHFWIPEVEKKHVYIYNMYICTYVYMYICILHDFALFGG